MAAVMLLLPPVPPASATTPAAASPPAPAWTPQTSPTTAKLNAVSFPDPTHGWAVGAGGTIVSTADGGRTWTTQPACSAPGPCGPTSPDRVGADLTGVSFVDAFHGWAVGAGGTIVSTADGGRTWTTQLACSAPGPCGRRAGDRVGADLTGVSFVDAFHGWAVGVAGTIVSTADGGRTWNLQLACPSVSNVEPPCSPAAHDATDFSGVSFVNAADGLIVGAGGTILVTDHGGATNTWQLPSGSGCTGCVSTHGLFYVGHAAHDARDLAAVTLTTDETGIPTAHAVGRGGRILLEGYKSPSWFLGSNAKGYGNFAPQASPTSGDLRSVWFTDAARGWAVGDAGTILATTDQGQTWSALASGTTATLNGVDFADANHGWAVGDGGTIVAWQTTPVGLAVTGVSPNRGSPAGLEQVTITGTGFTGATAVDFGRSWALGYVVNSDRSITAVLPPGGVGTVTVAVAAGGQVSATGPPNRFTYLTPVGSFAPTGSCLTPCDGPAIRLRNGEVLVEGTGSAAATTGQGSRPSALAQLYHPSTGRWSRTGAMHQRRQGQVAVLLHDGRVLVAGGQVDRTGNITATAEIYDPSSGRWTLTGSMHYPRRDALAVVLENGDVLVAGGIRSDYRPESLSGGPAASAEIYDPATGRWHLTGSMHRPRSVAPAVLLASGDVLVVGGTDGEGPVIGGQGDASAELYNPSTGRWSYTGSLEVPRHYATYTATALADGDVLVAGGMVLGAIDNRINVTVPYAELYHPATGSWTPTGPMLVPGAYQSAVALPGGDVLVVGGADVGGAPGAPSAGYLPYGQLYDPARGQWSLTGALATPRVDQTVLTLADGQVLVAGGVSSGSNPNPASDVTDSAELYTAPPSVVPPRPSSTSAGALVRGSLVGLAGAVVLGGLVVIALRRRARRRPVPWWLAPPGIPRPAAGGASPAPDPSGAAATVSPAGTASPPNAVPERSET